MFEIVKHVKNCQNFKKISKVVKIIKHCENCLIVNHIVQMLVRSRFLITPIKCLKGHKSLGLLFCVKNEKWLTQSLSDKVTY